MNFHKKKKPLESVRLKTESRQPHLGAYLLVKHLKSIELTPNTHVYERRIWVRNILAFALRD